MECGNSGLVWQYIFDVIVLVNEPWLIQRNYLENKSHLLTIVELGYKDHGYNEFTVVTNSQL